MPIEYIADGNIPSARFTVRQAATLIVAASDSLHRERADYVCDGVDDQVEIQAAIDALPLLNGKKRGKIFLFEGRYHISDTILISEQGVTLEGANMVATIIELDDHVNKDMIEVTAPKVAIKNLYMGGKKANQDVSTLRGIYVHAGAPQDLHLDTIYILEISGTGVLSTGSHDMFRNMYVEHTGIGYQIEGNESQLLGLGAYNCAHAYVISGSRNKLIGCGSFSGHSYGYTLIGASDCILSGCSASDFSSGGIWLQGAKRNLIEGCSLRTTSSGNYVKVTTSQDTPGVYSTHNMIKSCSFVTEGYSPPYGIYEMDADEDYNSYDGNWIKASTPIRRGGGTHFMGYGFSDFFMDILAASTNAVHAAITGTGAEQEITTAITNPDVPRNISITNSANSTGDVVITGVDAKGNSVTDTITIVTGGTGYGVVAFATVSKITIPATVANPDTISVGISDKLGLSNIIYATADVYKVKVNNADDPTIGTVNTTYDTVDCAAINAGDDITIWYKSNLNLIL